jgi:hypothetical protein
MVGMWKTDLRHGIEQTLGDIMAFAPQRGLVPGPLSRVPSS